MLDTPLFLSPLAGYTNLPFRLVIRELGGAGLCTTDLVSARSLLEKNSRAFKLIETRPGDEPLAVQIFGSVPEEMRDAALLLQERGVASVDINMGCPKPKVCRTGGASLMTDLAATARLVRTITGAVRLPVTCKMRLGWDDTELTAPDLARAVVDAGAAGVFVHGRTREQGFSGSVNRAGIAAVVRAVPGVPVIGNGDITTPQLARQMFDETGCAGVSLGRGAFYHPWIFRDIVEYLDHGTQRPSPSFDERAAVMRRHLDLLVEVFGEEKGCVMFRKMAPWYVKRVGHSAEFNRQVTRLARRDELDPLLDAYRTRLASSPRGAEPPAPASTTREALPVPQGPNELW